VVLNPPLTATVDLEANDQVLVIEPATAEPYAWGCRDDFERIGRGGSADAGLQFCV
jgi:hypothetical protein